MTIELPYIQLIQDIDYKDYGIFHIFEVDGPWIRNHIDVDFPDVGQHFDQDYIPPDEWWIDSEYLPEYNHEMVGLIALWEGRKNGLSRDEAMTKANRAEIKSRRESKEYSRFLDLFKKEILGFISDEIVDDKDSKTTEHILIVVVRGLWLRFQTDWGADFICGGHHYVYPQIPEDEIWIDDAMAREEIPPTIEHEFKERKKMKYEGWKYLPAHEYARKEEEAVRTGKQQAVEVISL